MNKRSQSNGCLAVVRKFFLSAFVVISFIAYALEKKMGLPVTGEAPPTIPPIESPVAATAAASPIVLTAAIPSISPTAIASPISVTATTAVVPTTGNGYKDGTYIGPSIYVNWGYVQIQATIQGGQISNIQFLQYPSDRRTSVRINSVAVPELQQEAIQAQSANVDIITGATLTSEGFQLSLQFALSKAQS